MVFAASIWMSFTRKWGGAEPHFNLLNKTHTWKEYSIKFTVWSWAMKVLSGMITINAKIQLRTGASWHLGWGDAETSPPTSIIASPPYWRRTCPQTIEWLHFRAVWSQGGQVCPNHCFPWLALPPLTSPRNTRVPWRKNTSLPSPSPTCQRHPLWPGTCPPPTLSTAAKNFYCHFLILCPSQCLSKSLKELTLILKSLILKMQHTLFNNIVKYHRKNAASRVSMPKLEIMLA